jgi:hypothetical protein
VTGAPENISRAFPEADAPALANLALDDCSFCIAIHTALSGRRWGAVPREALEEHADSMAQLLPAVFAYYLPAFMRAAIEYPEIPGVGASHSLDFTVQSLCDPELPEDHWWRERIALLSEEQRRAVAVFLEWVVNLLASEEDESRLHTQAQAGLANYWGRYLPK